MSDTEPAGLTPEKVDAALDACADKMFGERSGTAPTAFSEAIVVGLRRATVMVVAMTFGNEETRRAAYQADAVLQQRRRQS